MLVWRRGRVVTFARRAEDAETLGDFIAGLERPHAPLRRPGTALYPTSRTDVVPTALALDARHNGVVHEVR